MRDVFKALGLLSLWAQPPAAWSLPMDMPASSYSYGFHWGVAAALVLLSLMYFARTFQRAFLLWAAAVFWGMLAVGGGEAMPRSASPLVLLVWRQAQLLAAPLALWFLILLLNSANGARLTLGASGPVVHLLRWLPAVGAANVALAITALWSVAAYDMLILSNVALLMLAVAVGVYRAMANRRKHELLLLGLLVSGLALRYSGTMNAFAWPMDHAIFALAAVVATFWLTDQQRKRALGAYQAQLATTESQRSALERLKAAENALESKISQRTHELHLAVQRLETLSAQDGLTGVANRRRFDEVLKVECGRAARSRQALSVALIDVDWFEAFNARYGHERGDACLCKLARVLESGVMRSGDLIARYSGGAFVLLAPDTDANGITSIASYLCQEVFGLDLPNADSPYGRVSISIGVATAYSQESVAPEYLVQRAAAGLTNAKLQGRHRVVSG